MSLKGANALRKRMRAIGTVAEPNRSPLSRRWQEGTVNAARQMVPVRTGATRRSLRPGPTRRGRVTVVGKYVVNFIDAGSKAHVIPRQAGLTKTGRVSRRKLGTGKVLKFQVGGRTVFSKKVNKPRIGARPFKKRAAHEGLVRVNWATMVYGLWNKAA